MTYDLKTPNVRGGVVFGVMGWEFRVGGATFGVLRSWVMDWGQSLGLGVMDWSLGVTIWGHGLVFGS